MKKSSCYHKLRYKRYLKLIYRCLLGDMYIELTRERIPYKKIIYIYEKTHVIVLKVIIGLEITKLSYIKMLSFDPDTLF